jgi:hypothetical protein
LILVWSSQQPVTQGKHSVVPQRSQ